MNQNQDRTTVTRRRVLQFLTATGVIAVGGYGLSEYAPWLDFESQANRIRNPALEDSMTVQMQELVRYATLAANGHNTQPWKFAIKPDLIELQPDFSRHLPVVDPNNRELWISLGCALENMLVAARAFGYAPEVVYPNANDVVQVHLKSATAQKSPWFDAIPLRQNTRSEYDGKPVESIKLKRLRELPLDPGVSLRFMLEPKELETVLEYVNQGNLKQYADLAFVQELIHWLRFNKKEALASLDGLYSRCSGNPEVPRWLGQWFVSSGKPQAQADADAKKLRSSSGVIMISASSDDKTALLRTGQVYERLALEMTALNIQSAFLNQPIEVGSLREQFQNAMGLEDRLPQLLVRFGHANVMTRSLRRPVEQVLLQA
jgi:hypothetical protein